MKKRQGDILFVKIDVLPESLAAKDDGVIALGEQTGHKHLLVYGSLLTDKQNNMFITVTSELATIKHEEHRAITLPKGLYRVIKQREYDPEGWRDVKD